MNAIHAALAAVLLLTVTLYANAASRDQGLVEFATPEAVPEFNLPGVDGVSHRLQDFRGRYLLVNFWALWCAPCRKEMPSFERAYQRLKGDRFELIAIHFGPEAERVADYVAENNFSFPVLVDEGMTLGSWPVKGLPTTFLLDPQGRIIASATGERDWDADKLLGRLEDLMSLKTMPIEDPTL
jgi:thiol-disulfide isomerase/thioredoxin